MALKLWKIDKLCMDTKIIIFIYCLRLIQIVLICFVVYFLQNINQVSKYILEQVYYFNDISIITSI